MNMGLMQARKLLKAEEGWHIPVSAGILASLNRTGELGVIMPLRLLQIYVFSCAVVLAGAGCRAGAAQPRHELTFSFWGSYRDLEFWREVVDRFEVAHPEAEIVPQFTPINYGEKLQLQLISDSAADIILMDDEFHPAYAVRGYLEDLRPFIERDSAELRVDDFLPNALRAFTYWTREGGESREIIGALPWDGTAVLMFYNRDLFDEAGIPPPQEDWTWEDFRRIAIQLTRDYDGDGRTDQFGAMLGFGWLDAEPLVWSFGGRFLSGDCTRAAVRDDDRVMEAARFMQGLKFTDRVLIWFGSQQGMNREVQILTGRIAMSPSGWFAAQVLGETDTDVRWGVCHMPRGPRGDRFTRVTFDGLSINRNIAPEKKAVAWAFLKFVLTEEIQARLATVGRGVPVVREYAERHFLDGETFADRKIPDFRNSKAVVLEAMEEYGRLTPITPRYLGLRRVIEAAWARLEREDPGQRWTPARVAAEIEAGVNRELQKELEDFGAARGQVTARSPAPYRIAGLLAVLGLAAMLVRRGAKAGSLFSELGVLRRNRMRRREALWGVLLASPWMAGFLVFLAFPIVFSLVLSFSAWDPYDPVEHRTFVGMDNYVRALTRDPYVWFALRKTFTYAALAVPINLCGALGLALLLNQKLRGIRVFRTLFYLPNVVGGVATAIMWLYFFNPVLGPVNNVLRALNRALDATPLAFLNLPDPNWFNDPDWAMPSMIIMMLWATGGGAMIIFLAGLQSIPSHLYEAAELDGAGRWRQFVNVTVPMLTPTIFFNLIMGIIGALQVFMQAFVLVGRDGGFDNQLLFFVLYLYRKAFVDYQFGYAAALAWVLFAIILAFTLLIFRSSALWVYYEGERR